MPQKDVRARILMPADTDLKWQTLNPVLLDGERVIVSDLHRTKTGNGSTAYKALPFDDENIYTAIAAALASAEGLIGEVGGRAPPLPSTSPSGTHILGAAISQGKAQYFWLEYGETPVNTVIERIELLEKMVFTHELTSNPYMVLFDNLDGMTTTGVWRRELQCLEC